MATLLAKLQHFALYPKSPRVFSALLDLLDEPSEEKVAILASAFSEIVGFIEESNGNDLPNLNSALRALARFHKSPENVTMDLNSLAEKKLVKKMHFFQNNSDDNLNLFIILEKTKKKLISKKHQSDYAIAACHV